VRWALLLEYIDAWSLKYYDLPQWAGAVRRLADLHAHFAAQPARLSRCDALLRFDADYFRAWAQRALDAAARCAADLGRRLEPVVHESGIAAEFIVSMPPTLVHNDLSPKNVLLDRSQEPSTVAFVDWEMAGIGCGLLDLAHLTYGLDAAGVRWLCDAYRTAWSGPVPLPANDSEFGRPFASCQLHKTLYRLARWEAWRVPPARVAQWVSEAERLCARISSGEGVGA
jgi:Ser/Thr protein kinase RdoA (MazF antagonist)